MVSAIRLLQCQTGFEFQVLVPHLEEMLAKVDSIYAVDEWNEWGHAKGHIIVIAMIEKFSRPLPKLPGQQCYFQFPNECDMPSSVFPLGCPGRPVKG